MKLKAKFHMRLGASKQVIRSQGISIALWEIRHPGHLGVQLEQVVSLDLWGGGGREWRALRRNDNADGFQKGSCYLITRICSTTVLTVYNQPSVRDRRLAATLQWKGTMTVKCDAKKNKNRMLRWPRGAGGGGQPTFWNQKFNIGPWAVLSEVVLAAETDFFYLILFF